MVYIYMYHVYIQVESYSKHNVDCRRPGPCNLLN